MDTGQGTEQRAEHGQADDEMERPITGVHSTEAVYLARKLVAVEKGQIRMEGLVEALAVGQGRLETQLQRLSDKFSNVVEERRCDERHVRVKEKTTENAAGIAANAAKISAVATVQTGWSVRWITLAAVAGAVAVIATLLIRLVLATR